MTQYKRILLKLSGESLQGQQGYGLDPQMLASYAEQIKAVADSKVLVKSRANIKTQTPDKKNLLFRPSYKRLNDITIILFAL